MKKFKEWPPDIGVKFLTVLVILAVAVMFHVEQSYAVPGEWEGSISLGGDLTSGNTNESAFNFVISGEQRLPNDRYTFNVGINHGKTGDVKTKQNIYGFFQADHFFSPALYGYLNAEMEKDKIGKDLNLGATIGPGFGLQLWETAQGSASIEGGLAYSSKDLDKGSDSQGVATRLALNYFNKISDRVSFKDFAVLNSDIVHLDDYKLRNEAVLSTALTDNWNFDLKNIFQRNNRPAEGVGKEDMTTAWAFRHNF